MRLKRIELTNFRGFERFALDLHPECTLLVGVNGSGKSSVLAGLEVALGAWTGAFGVARGILDAEVRRVKLDKPGARALEPVQNVIVAAQGEHSGRSRAWELRLPYLGAPVQAHVSTISQTAEEARTRVWTGEPVELPVVVSYGPWRGWGQPHESWPEPEWPGSRMVGYTGCFDPAAHAHVAESWHLWRGQVRVQKLAKALERGEPAQDEDEPLLQGVESAVAACVEGAERVAYSFSENELQAEFADGRVLPLSLLSDGARDAIALASDLAWRAAMLNPHHGREAAARATGVVLVDEVELHLHPGWQRHVIPNLRRAFPGIQFVFTTHSPQVIASVPAQCIRLLGAEGQVAAVHAAEGLDSNTILRDLMGVPERPQAVEQRLRELGAAIEAGDLETARRELEDLRALLGHDDPTLTGLAWELHDVEVNGPRGAGG